MELDYIIRIPLICVLTGILSGAFAVLVQDENRKILSCYQCNVFVRGTPWTCDDEERGMDEREDCVSCMKSYTRTYLHNTFHDQILTDYTSHLCVRSKEYSKKAGCYKQETASGYMERCFCYDNLCNGDARISASTLTFFLPVLLLIAKRFGLMNV